MPTATEIEPQEVWLCVNSHAGQKPTKVLLLRRWDKLCLIKAITETKTGGRGKILLPGETARVPTWTIHTKIEKNSMLVKDMKYWAVQVKTAGGLKVRAYRARTTHSCRSQAEKLADVIWIGTMQEISEADYDRIKGASPARIHA